MSAHQKYLHILRSIEKYTSIDHKAFLESQKQSPHVSVKINTLKLCDNNSLDFSLAGKVVWANDAYYLKERPAFYADPLFYAGTYYVMDSSSMFLETILNHIQLPQNSVVLDVAAAPGGKSVVISNFLNNDDLLWANEINYSRAQTLHYNLSKWGKSNYVVSNNDTQLFASLSEVFDLIVCDAPCTGSGLFRKYPGWIHSFNENLVQQCVFRQKQILQNIFPSLKENGYLIYSTCSFMSEENEEISQFIVNNGFEYVDVSVPQDSGIIKTNFGIRFFPHLTRSEGFFYAVFRKIQPTVSRNILLKNKKTHYPEMISHTKPVPFADYINIQQQHRIYKYQNKYYLSNMLAQEYLQIHGSKWMAVGTTISDEKAHIPSPELALSVHLKNDWPRLDLDKAQAQKFLKKENLILAAEKKLYLITYKEQGLGWAKVLENRVNNYFPSEWRIIKDVNVADE
ncbi:MAG: rRNA cytosine-C5-methyltransferase [Bacteroidia bacterium]|nr:MAG: rRNA cytosine-C5-methyltransferase [Bacteroidia bacterium]